MSKPSGLKKKRNQMLCTQIQKAMSNILPSYVGESNLVTVSYVSLNLDLMNAKIYLSILDLSLSDYKVRKKVENINKHFLIKYLNDIKPKIRGELTSYIKIRFIPDIKFYLDEQLEHINHIESLIQKVKQGN